MPEVRQNGLVIFEGSLSMCRFTVAKQIRQIALMYAPGKRRNDAAKLAMRVERGEFIGPDPEGVDVKVSVYRFQITDTEYHKIPHCVTGNGHQHWAGPTCAIPECANFWVKYNR